MESHTLIKKHYKYFWNKFEKNQSYANRNNQPKCKELFYAGIKRKKKLQTNFTLLQVSVNMLHMLPYMKIISWFYTGIHNILELKCNMQYHNLLP
jgi:hypothetical protein